ncbi:CheY-like chemotaxis protein [Bradyrhizobium sp. LM6.10]
MTATILFVDDEPDLEALVLQKFRRQIRDGLVTIMFARDGLEALQSLEQNPHVDMVVSDINMPRMDGLSLLAKLQEAEDKKSTIIVSAYGDMSNIRTAMNRGAFDFLTKPIDFADLEMTIQKTIRHIEMLREVRGRQAEAERAHAALSRHFSPELAKRLAAGSEGKGIEVQWRDVATIFTDITGFTSLVESAPPETLGALLNEYVGGMTEVVFAQEGTVAKIIGDAIQVLFNAPGDQPDYVTRAVACAHGLDAWAEDFSARWKTRGVNFGTTRISAFTPGRPWSAISAATGSSTTPRTATPSTSRRGWKPQTSIWAHGFASVPASPRRLRIFKAVPSASCCCADAASRCARSSRWRRPNSLRRKRRCIPRLLPRWRPVTAPPCRLLPRWSECMPTTPSPAFT